MVGLDVLRGAERNGLGPFDRLLVARRQLAQEIDRLVAFAEQPPDEGVPGRRGEVGVLLGAVRQVEAEVGLALDADAGQGDRAAGKRQALDALLVIASLLSPPPPSI